MQLDTTYHFQIPEIYHQIDTISSTFLSTGIETNQAGIEQSKYLKDSNTLVLLHGILLFFFIIIVCKGGSYITHSMHSFFIVRRRANIFVNSGQLHRTIHTLILPITFYCSSLYLYLFINRDRELISEAHFLKTTFFYTLFIALLSVLKFAFFHLIGYISNSPIAKQTWIDTYISNTALMGITYLFLFPIIIQSNLSAQNQFILFGIIFIFYRFIVFYKLFLIFPHSKSLWYYLFLYLCGVEIIPILFLYRLFISLYNCF